MKDQNIELEKDSVQQKRLYEKPRLMIINLMADQVLSGCRSTPAPFGDCVDLFSGHS